MAKLSGGRRSSWKSGAVEALADDAPASGKLDKDEGLMRGAVAMLAVEPAGIGIVLRDPAATLESGGSVAELMLDAIEPVDESVEVNGMARLAFFFCVRATASESEAGEPLRCNASIIATEAVVGDVTRDSGAEAVLSSAADEEEEDEELGLELP